MLLSISGYEGIERDHIGKLAAVLKIPFSERFSRQTTHLICHPPFKGPKYDRAIKWGIPVIESSWLYDLSVYGALECDRRMEVVPEESAGIEVGRRAEAITGHRSMPPPPSVVRKAVQSPAAAAMVTTPVSINKGRTPLKTPLSKVSQREAPNGTPEVTPMDVSLDHNMQQAIDRLSTTTGH
ncbi:protein kinase activating protein dpb11 [Linderina macrospora]|uniref:Protein kinase activating protein dpb11 n=1 Tax=Linderina macrospora TaxID=4868 RepID=A0ACC1J6J1_9FUNG|nr:protein kinase activating protein dpb11 [Linderina macrospora]